MCVLASVDLKSSNILKRKLYTIFSRPEIVGAVRVIHSSQSNVKLADRILKEELLQKKFFFSHITSGFKYLVNRRKSFRTHRYK